MRLSRIVQYLRSTGRKVPEGYLERALRAEALFHYQPVYNPRTKEIFFFSEPSLLPSPPPSLSTSVSSSSSSSQSSFSSSYSNLKRSVSLTMTDGDSAKKFGTRIEILRRSFTIFYLIALMPDKDFNHK